MSTLTYRDIPLVIAHGFHSENTISLFGYDKDGNTWQCVEGDTNDFLKFRRTGIPNGEWRTFDIDEFHERFF